MKIDLINVEDGLASIALRSVLEYWGCTVTIHHTATAKQLVQLLNGATPLSDYVILMCHGIEQGLALPELTPEIAAQQPYQTAINADQFLEFLDLPNCVVVNTGCLLGKAEFALAFLQAGCHTYVGSTDYPEGDSALFFVLHFFFELQVNKSELRISYQKAAAHNPDTQTFQIYQPLPTQK